MEKIFLKASYRVKKFREIAKDVPPQPVIIRRGTWLNASLYYSEHFKCIKRVVDELDSEDAISIKKVQKLFKSSRLSSNLIYIKANFGTLPESIAQSITHGLRLSESLKTLNEIINSINKAPKEIGIAINKKMKNVLK